MIFTRYVSATVLPAAACFYGMLLLGCGEPTPTPDAAPPDAAPIDAGPSINPCQLLIDDEARPGHPFDVQRFEAEILPDLQATCARAGCHLGDGGSGYRVWVDSDSSCATVESFNAFYARTDFAVEVDNSPILRTIDGTTEHPGSPIDPQLVAEIRGFIQDAHVQYTGEAGPGGCAPATRFDLAVFEDEIMPYFEALVDYNDTDTGRSNVGCARSECHGRDRGPGTFHIDPSRTPAANLDSFRCFVNLQNPSASQALACPLNLSTCQAAPHPGADVFFGVDDLNYQKLFAFVLAAKNGDQPLDFAFFVRKINPMLNDENAVQDGLIGLTCASQGCHSAPSDNGVNFDIIPEATTPQDLFINYVEAAKFVYAPNVTQSSLFMYPTNQVANPDNAAATNQQHPGGECFAVADQEALDVLEFAGGLRPDGQGFLHHFLVAGLFPAIDVTDEPVENENLTTPRIFDRSGQSGQFNQGLWDLHSSAGENVDFLQAFSVADAEAQLAFAVAYVLNTTPNDLDIVITVRSENDVMLLAGTALDSFATTVGRDGADATLSVSLSPFESSQKLTRLMVKAYQQADEPGLGFSIQFTDDNGNLLTNATGELVFALGGEGGGL
jgi:hypothetical protein